jgi:hypothetical protein
VLGYKTVAGESCDLSQEEKSLERSAAQKYFSVGSFAKSLTPPLRLARS